MNVCFTTAFANARPLLEAGMNAALALTTYQAIRGMLCESAEVPAVCVHYENRDPLLNILRHVVVAGFRTPWHNPWHRLAASATSPRLCYAVAAQPLSILTRSCVIIILHK